MATTTTTKTSPTGTSAKKNAAAGPRAVAKRTEKSDAAQEIKPSKTARSAKATDAKATAAKAAAPNKPAVRKTAASSPPAPEIVKSPKAARTTEAISKGTTAKGTTAKGTTAKGTTAKGAGPPSGADRATTRAATTSATTRAATTSGARRSASDGEASSQDGIATSGRPAALEDGPVADEVVREAAQEPRLIRASTSQLLLRKQPAPSRRTEGYTEERFLSHQRHGLERERATYLEQAKSLKAEAESLVEEMEPGDIQFDDESGEGGTVTVDRERDLALSAQAMLAVEEIDHALAKMGLNTYGICENCGRLIPKARLEALPYARLCIDCKSGGLSRR
ncbi:MAG: TraR/DksA C4-type zinc finger protein [Actinomycetota bacterium]|nr:TraR/DksA C4-type zinc finger protein [Actinomycetota bacterium]